MDNGIFQTNSRKLEQFLFLHDIFHQGWHKDVDNMTVWEYQETEELKRVVEEFRAIQARRRAREGGHYGSKGSQGAI